MTLTKVQRITLLAGVPLTAAAIGWGGLNAVAAVGRGTESVHTLVPVQGGAVSAKISSGDITLATSAGGTATLTGTLRYSLIKPALTVSPGRDETDIGYDCAIPVGWCGMDATLAVPSSVRAVHLSTDQGNVTASGAVVGTLSLSSSMGDITATGVSAADVTAHSDMGNVTITFTAVPTSVSVSSSMGDVSIVLPHDNTKYRLNASTSLGDRTVASDVQQSDSATHVIIADSSMGNVTITEAS